MVETLLQVAAGDVPEPEARVLDCKLVERKSTGVPGR
jgi:hypothetical protein